MKSHWNISNGKVRWRDLTMSQEGLINCLNEYQEVRDKSEKEVDKLRLHLYNIHRRYREAGFVFFESASALEGDE
jgi:hypothetical protein